MTLKINDHLADYPVQVGLVASFFSLGSDRNALALIAAFERYAGRFGSQARWFMDAETNRLRQLDSRAVAYPRRRWPKSDSLHWSLSSTDDRDVPNIWSLRAHVERESPGPLNYLWWSIDPSSEIPGTLREVFLDVARMLPCQHAYGGLGLVQPLDVIPRQESEPEAYVMAARFHGLDVLGASRTRCDALDGIKCVNWLTLLDDSLLAKLGGQSALRGRLSEAIVFHDIPNGVVLQAGDKPVLGDVHAPDELAAYREVAIALKPIFATGPYGRFREMDGFPDGVNDWRNRFFPGAKWPP